MTWTRTATGAGVVAILALLLVAVMAAPVTAASEKHRDRTPPGQAKFEGRHIDLKRGWGDAQTCVVWQQDGETDCFRTEQAADAAVARRERAEARNAAASTMWSMAMVSDRRAAPDLPEVQLTSSCGDWLVLYEHVGYDGRSLRFRDRGYYQDLANWGFANETSSYQVGGCATSLRDGAWASYPGWTGAYASAWSMASGWNDRIRYLRIS